MYFNLSSSYLVFVCFLFHCRLRSERSSHLPNWLAAWVKTSMHTHRPCCRMCSIDWAIAAIPYEKRPNCCCTNWWKAGCSRHSRYWINWHHVSSTKTPRFAKNSCRQLSIHWMSEYSERLFINIGNEQKWFSIEVGETCRKHHSDAHIDIDVLHTKCDDGAIVYGHGVWDVGVTAISGTFKAKHQQMNMNIYNNYYECGSPSPERNTCFLLL